MVIFASMSKNYYKDNIKEVPAHCMGDNDCERVGNIDTCASKVYPVTVERASLKRTKSSLQFLRVYPHQVGYIFCLVQKTENRDDCRCCHQGTIVTEIPCTRFIYYCHYNSKAVAISTGINSLFGKQEIYLSRSHSIPFHRE